MLDFWFRYLQSNVEEPGILINIPKYTTPFSTQSYFERTK